MGACCSSHNTQQSEVVKQKNIKELKLQSTNYAEDKEPWKKIPVPNRVKISVHEHELLKMPSNQDPDWACNSMQMLK